MDNQLSVFETTFINFDGEEKTLKEIINPETDIFDLKDRYGNLIGKKMITIEGVNKISRFFKAVFGKPETIDTPNKENSQGYVVLVDIKFPNGDTHYEIGEANNINLKGGAIGYKYTMAVKRAKSRALLKSPTVALDYFLTEDEIVDNSDLQVQRQNEVTTHVQPLEDSQSNASNLTSELTISLNDFSLSSLVLPKSDKKYPNTSIIDILKQFDDREYLKQLKSTYPHNKDLRNAITALSQRVGFDEKNQTNTLNEFIEEINHQLNLITTKDEDKVPHEFVKDDLKENEVIEILDEELFTDTEAFLASLQITVQTETEKVEVISSDALTATTEDITELKVNEFKNPNIFELLEEETKVETPKKKRGRPKKVKLDEELLLEEPKKIKRGRPKKIKNEEN